MKHCIPILFWLATASQVHAEPIFRPEFIAIHSPDVLTTSSVKWTNPIYNLVGWKRSDGTVEHDVFKAGEVIALTDPSIETEDGGMIRWKFSHEAIKVEAELSEGKLSYTFTAKKSGLWSVSYSGAPATPMDEVIELFQPLVWNGRRMPEAQKNRSTKKGCRKIRW